jgi:hypothetical protein
MPPPGLRVVGIAKEMFVGTSAYVTADGYAQATGRPDQERVTRRTLLTSFGSESRTSMRRTSEWPTPPCSS